MPAIVIAEREKVDTAGIRERQIPKGRCSPVNERKNEQKKI
jgi:hypothetical protein